MRIDSPSYDVAPIRAIVIFNIETHLRRSERRLRLNWQLVANGVKRKDVAPIRANASSGLETISWYLRNVSVSKSVQFTFDNIGDVQSASLQNRIAPDASVQTRRRSKAPQFGVTSLQMLQTRPLNIIGDVLKAPQNVQCGNISTGALPRRLHHREVLSRQFGHQGRLQRPRP